MPDLLHSTKHPLQPERLHIRIKLHHGIPPGATDLFNFAHLSRDASSALDSHGHNLSLTNLVGNRATEATAIEASFR